MVLRLADENHSDLRTVNLVTKQKRPIVYGILACWLVFAPVSWLAALLIAGAVIGAMLYVGRMYHLKALAHYRSRELYVLHSGGERASQEAKRVSDALSADKLPFVCRALKVDDGWKLISGSKSVVLVLDDDDFDNSIRCPGVASLEQFLNDESQCRMRSGFFDGWNTNIVYTSEGLRRRQFLRLAFCSVNVSTSSPRAETLASHFQSLGVLRFPNLSSLISLSLRPSPAADVPSLRSTWNWMLACPCCTQREAEMVRWRNDPNLSLGDPTFSMMIASLKDTTAQSQLIRAFISDPWKSFHQSLFPSAEPLPYPNSSVYTISSSPYWLNHPPVPKSPPPHPLDTISFVCQFGDASLLSQPSQALPPLSSLRLNPDASLRYDVGLRPDNRWTYEAFARFSGPQLIVKDPFTGLCLPYQIPDQDTLSLLNSILSSTNPTEFGTSNITECLHQWLVETRVLIPKNAGEMNAALEKEFNRVRGDLDGRGWTVLKPFSLIPAPFWCAVRRFYRQLRPWMYSNMGNGKGKFRTWNDEPVARMLQEGLTEWASKASGEYLASSALALSIFIDKGPGFAYHKDSSPPFDLTLDIVIDHQGPSPRPVYFARPSQNGKATDAIVEKLELAFGEAALFKGGQVVHWGGDLPEGSTHCVQLYTWQFMRD